MIVNERRTIVEVARTAMNKIKTPTINHLMRKYFGNWPMFGASREHFSVRWFGDAAHCYWHHLQLDEQVVALYVMSTFKWLFFLASFFSGICALYLRWVALQLALRGVNCTYFLLLLLDFCRRRRLNLQLHWTAIRIPRKTTLPLILFFFRWIILFDCRSAGRRSATDKTNATL